MKKNPFITTFRLFVIPLLVILSACGSLVQGSGNVVKTPVQVSPQVPNTGGGPSVTVNDQDFDGTTVIVADVISQGPGWMVIHNQVNGSVGEAIGETPVNNGENKDVAVKIDPTQATPIMYAMLHVDAGTVGKYEFPGPDIPVMVNGQMLSPGFKATVQSNSANITPAITVADQDVSGGKVTITSVASNGPGWVAIHIQGADGNPGAEIGYTAVKSGTSQNVVVNIDASKATPILFAMLHVDAGTVGKYEFPGPDGPQVVNGQMVAPTFKTSPSAASTATTPTPDTGMSMTTPAVNGNEPMVKVSDQPLNGNSVMVDDVVSSGPGWIVIYTTNAQGQPDQAIGHAAVKDGDNPNVMVQVDPAKAQGTLYAQLQADMGTIGTFEYPGPDQPVMTGVQMIAGSFKIVSAQAINGGAATPVVLQPSVTVKDQAVVNGTVTIPQVVSNGNWWLVIHRQDANGTMGEYIGQTLIKNGINTNVVVKINMSLATPVLYAMLHVDNPPVGILEFPGSDSPVLVNGQMVAPSFNVTGIAQDITLNIHKVSDTVSFLTNGDGYSLYISLKDSPGKSNCDVACLKIWKPLLASGRVLPGAGVTQANLGVITLPDGTRQVTYLGAPLYTYSKDVNPGDTTGQGIEGVWFLVTP